MDEKSFGHIPVLFHEYIDSLNLSTTKRNIVVDCTLGLGGHAVGIIKKLHTGDIFVGFDLDNDNLSSSKETIEKSVGCFARDNGITIHCIHANFKDIKTKLSELGIDTVTAVCYDLGVSSAHFDDADRGFSFRFTGKLDMRFDREHGGKTAGDIINHANEKELIEMLRIYGEEPKARFIAEAIVKTRKIKPIETTEELTRLIEETSYDPKSVVRSFQGIRIAVNDEFGSIETSLKDTVNLLSPGGRCAVITFHSLEDRLVKQIFAEYLQAERDEFTGQDTVPAILKKVTKKPLLPTEEEMKQNKRSRSAKLRIVEKR
ncbi:16S rRNA (cytosine(1402)-N(4))-methyltransferase RsmH [Candidatus Gracilibacteria bacterium]|nr:16S rRNA (cytosine(1402)-N(4))-methyltransferase RsmH [Candidatus Gracilibacteria bacterium]OIO76019.1 MAG: 16S rRNA (cytosine(1402)-N(4))-methyltransferase [Candidatus Gracilibacteria bacterium CG1_02_38_174]